MVVFVTGMSEYSSSQLDPIVSDANKANISIYALGVNIPNGPKTAAEYRDLKFMSSNSYGGQFYSISPNNVESDISSTIDNILQKSCDVISKQPVAKNVIITDSIYPYLKVEGTSQSPDSTIINSDGTTTLVWKLGDMSQAQTKTITINTALEFNKLPIDVSNKRTAVSFSPSIATPPSVITYTAMTDEARVVPLPEGELSVFCGSPPCPPVAKVVPPASPGPAANNTSAGKPIEVKKQPGFEGWLAIVGLMGVVYLFRRKNEGA
jgi:hypothetical protein